MPPALRRITTDSATETAHEPWSQRAAGISSVGRHTAFPGAATYLPATRHGELGHAQGNSEPGPSLAPAVKHLLMAWSEGQHPAHEGTPGDWADDAVYGN